MRRFFNIFAVAALLLSLASCKRDSVYEDDVTPPEDIILPAGNYITFYADANTRASLLTTNYIEQPFGVYGYKYDFSSTWNGQRAMAVPNVFWNLKSSTKVPLKVSYNGGLYEYNAAEGSPNRDGSGQVNWSSSRYAFWAYYPYEGYDAANFAISGMEQEGAPYVTYTVDRASTKKMYDVMTGGISQVTAASSGNTVTFTMYHRLSAVDVSINNAYQHEYQVDGVNYTEDVNIVITDLKLHFENLKYSEAKIFLERDKSIPALNTVLTAPTKSEDGETVLDPSQMVANYQLVGGTDPDIGPTVTVGPTTSKFNLTTEAGATMTFIPQETSDLRVTADISYHMVGATSGAQISKLRVNDEGEPLDSEGNVTDDPSKFIYDNAFTITKTTDFKQPLVETTRYFIVLNFTSEAVSINIITAEAWDERTVDYEFM